MLEKLYIIFFEKSCPEICVYKIFFVPLQQFSRVKISGKHRVKSVRKPAQQQILTCCNTGS